MRRLIFALLALALGTAAVVRAVSVTDSAPTIGPNVFVSQGDRLDANNSPSLARNPRRPENLALTYRIDRTAFSAVLASSDDGGDSWRRTPLPLPPGLDRPFAPDLAFAPDGTLYVSYVNLVGNGNVPENLWLSRSSDGGRTLSPPVRVATGLPFQGRIAVAGDGTVHLTWLRAAEVGLFRLARFPNPIVASHSTDRGQTFSEPVTVSDPGRVRVAAATPVVDSENRLLVLYGDFKSDRRDFEFLEGPPAEEPFALVLTASTDGGRTFSPGVEVESGVVAGRRFLVFLPEFPSLAAGPGESLAVAWADARSGSEDVYLRRSADGGRTWSEAARVNDNPIDDGTDQYLPRVAVSPSGRTDVLFLDRRRDDANVMTDATLGSSDDGRSFRNRRVSSESFDSRVGPYIDATFDIDFGSRLGIVAGEPGPVMAWTDSRLGDEGTGRQDIVAARMVRGSAGVGEWVGVGALALLALACAGMAVAPGRVRGGRGGGPDSSRRPADERASR